MDDEPADEAIFALNGKEYEGQSLQVNQARGRHTDR
jgi:RNA recognition motif-containing protein